MRSLHEGAVVHLDRHRRVPCEGSGQHRAAAGRRRRSGRVAITGSQGPAQQDPRKGIHLPSDSQTNLLILLKVVNNMINGIIVQ